MRSDITDYLFALQSRINKQDLSVNPQDYQGLNQNALTNNPKCLPHSS